LLARQAGRILALVVGSDATRAARADSDVDLILVVFDSGHSVYLQYRDVLKYQRESIKLG
jgi:predicted nucleotidyltransferase